MSEDYARPRLASLEFDFTKAALTRADAFMTLSRKDVLAIVQAALRELETDEAERIAIMREVLDVVAAGRLADALRCAIVHAGRGARSGTAQGAI
ncbi:MAG: hypothetical protein GC147_03985 [Porphyrobacter sp.]|nr:hypothetical protein [Porphyrobacter sp.]